MSRINAEGTDGLPRRIELVGSALILLHLGAIVVAALASPSGPWPTNFGPSMALEPQFARSINEPAAKYYLRPLHLAGNYHFASNRNDLPPVKFEVKLRDRDGSVLQTLHFPEPSANFWVRQRQKMLALGLGDDLPVQPPRGEAIPAPGQKVRTVAIWDSVDKDSMLTLREVPEHLVPRDRQVYRPHEWALLLARAYSRYLCREYGAASAEVIRHSREPITPAILFAREPSPDAFDELVCSFGQHGTSK
jgi:hypothetical protein